jgi:hypothetical protein
MEAIPFKVDNPIDADVFTNFPGPHAPLPVVVGRS